MKTTAKLTSLALLSTLNCSVASAALIGSMTELTPEATTTTFSGNASIVNGANYDNGEPTNANPGLVSFVANWATTGIFKDSAVLQTGGSVSTGSLPMRGGAEGTGKSSIYVIDDSNNSNFGYKNLEVTDDLSFWTQHTGGGGQELSLLNGYVTAGELKANAGGGESTINIKNGKMDIGFVSTVVNLNVNMLAGGTGEILIADGDAMVLDSMNLNFETGSSVSFTILKDTNMIADDARGFWGDHVASGHVFIDGVSVSDVNLFSIQDVGLTGTSISLIPEPSSAALLLGLVSFVWLAIYRR